jgi:hypothetical protein
VGTGGEAAALGKRRSWIDGVVAREKGTGEDHGGKVAANGEDAMDADGETTSFGEDKGGIAAREEGSASVLEETREAAGQAPWHGTAASLGEGSVAVQAAAHGEEAARRRGRGVAEEVITTWIVQGSFFSFLLIMRGGWVGRTNASRPSRPFDRCL